MEEIKYKKITFRVDENTYDDLQNTADKQYLSLSAYIRKILMTQLQQEV